MADKRGTFPRGGRKGGKRKDAVEGESGAGANQPLSTPPIHGGHAPWRSCSHFLLVPVCPLSLSFGVVSFTPTEIIVIGVARRLHELTRAICAATFRPRNLCRFLRRY